MSNYFNEGGELDQVMHDNKPKTERDEDNFYSDDSSASSYDVQTNKRSDQNDFTGPSNKRQMMNDSQYNDGNDHIRSGPHYSSQPIINKGRPQLGSKFGDGSVFINTGYIYNPEYNHQRHDEFYPRDLNHNNIEDETYNPGGKNYNNGGKNPNYHGYNNPTANVNPRTVKYPLHVDEKTEDVAVDKERVALDSYTADLNIHVKSPEALTAYPVTHSINAWIFGNIRCTHGIRVPIEAPPNHIKVSSNQSSSSRRIKCGFEVKIDECLEFDRELIPRQEHKDAHFIRVGWSEVNCQGNLGEERDSIGLDSLGRVLAEGQCFRHEFSKVCCNLRDGDIIGAYIEYDSVNSQAHFSFRVNDKNLGVLAKIPAKADESIFVPHILTKNMRFTVNFGTLGVYKTGKSVKPKKKFKKKRRSRSRSGSSSRSSRSSKSSRSRSSRSRSTSRSRSRSRKSSTFGSSDESSDGDFGQTQNPSWLPSGKQYLRNLPPVPEIDPKENERLDFGDDEKDEKAEESKRGYDKKARYAPLIGDDFHLSRIVRCAGIIYRENPLDNQDCEVIMVMGLPGCGKTTWIRKFLEKEDGRYKRYCVIGTETILGRAAILGKARNFKAGSTILPKTYNINDKVKETDGKMEDADMLRVPMSHLQTKWLEVAHNRKRNYILDQLNVFPGTHIKKMKIFEQKGYSRTAAVIMPRDKEYRARKYKREDELRQEIAKKNVLELKSGIELPIADGVLFQKVIFPECDRDECQKIVEKYNEEGKEFALHSQSANSTHGASVTNVNTGYTPVNQQSYNNRQRPSYGSGGNANNKYYNNNRYDNNRDYNSQRYNNDQEKRSRKRNRTDPSNSSSDALSQLQTNPLAALGLGALGGLGGLGAGALGALGGGAALGGGVGALGGGAAALGANPLAALSSMTAEQQQQWSTYYQQIYQTYYQQYAALYGQGVASQMFANAGVNTKRE